MATRRSRNDHDARLNLHRRSARSLTDAGCPLDLIALVSIGTVVCCRSTKGSEAKPPPGIDGGLRIKTRVLD
jgi:hypothetical protein